MSVDNGYSSSKATQTVQKSYDSVYNLHYLLNLSKLILSLDL